MSDHQKTCVACNGMGWAVQPNPPADIPAGAMTPCRWCNNDHSPRPYPGSVHANSPLGKAALSIHANDDGAPQGVRGKKREREPSF